MKKSALGFSISASWGPRPEEPEQLARRCLTVFHRLRIVDPEFSHWFVGKNMKGIPLHIEQQALYREILSEKHAEGYGLYAKTQQKGSGPRNLNFDFTASFKYRNIASLYTDYGRVPDPAIVSYHLYNEALLADAFDVERAFAYPSSLSALRPPPPGTGSPFALSWISYVTPRLASLVTAPDTAIVHHRSDGSLVMAATDEVFDVGNARHVAVAQDIVDGAALLHGRPWEPFP